MGDDEGAIGNSRPGGFAQDLERLQRTLADYGSHWYSREIRVYEAPCKS